MQNVGNVHFSEDGHLLVQSEGGGDDEGDGDNLDQTDQVRRFEILISFILIYIDDVHSIIPSEGLVCGGLVLNKINLFSIARFDCQVKQSSERIVTCFGKQGTSRKKPCIRSKHCV